MPARHTLHVALPEALVRDVRDPVASARHEAASDVVRAALQASIRRDGTARARIRDARAKRPDHV